MLHKLLHSRCLVALQARLKSFRNRRGAVALIIALSVPVLLATTGLAVDVGFWYQQQDTLQSATDAAALAAATANKTAGYAVTSPTTAEPYAVTAANNASNSQFGLTSSTVNLTYTPGTPLSSGTDGTTISTWQATATIPRASFFSRVKGMGLTGLLPGTQSTSSTAIVKTVTNTTGGACLLSLGTAGQSVIGNVSTNGNTIITANGCNIAADSSAGAPSCSTNFSQNNTSNAAITAVGQASITTTNTTGTSILTAGCAATSGQAVISGAGGTTSNDSNVQQGAPIETDPLYYMGDVPTFWYDNSTNLASIPPCAEITLSGSGNSASVLITPPLQDNGNDLTRYTYCLFDSSSNAYTIPTQGTVTFASASNNTSGVSYFFNNGFSAGSQTAVSFGPGIYYFDGTAGLSVGGGSSITTTGSGATFAFAGSTSYSLGGSTTAFNMSAPSSNCVAPQNYNAPADSQNQYIASLYNMTSIENGQGICGILIYQARNDTTVGTLSGGGGNLVNATINGIIYAPKAGFVDSGHYNIGSTSGGTFAVLADNFTVNGNGTLSVSIGTNSNDLAASLIKAITTTSAEALLVQ
ncbi:pilus assembly protein TadG-related protein [Acidocella sp.]|uniref:pilus assembly protein TadG-related protein n=1 Tax=Acidocella sp. TaxID=50710 RepID=UPI0017A3F5D7|nr:pilus assembly protein TadG-related protein [Acidocella sp.]NNM58017.1 hypothetical protein [Acidocella sp.]